MHPHLTPLAGRIVEDTTVETLAGHDAVFLALPHGHSAALAAELPEGTAVIDCGAGLPAPRRRPPGPPSTTPRMPGRGPTGCPSCVGAEASSARRSHGERRIAVPGCYPTAASLALAPGFAGGLLAPEGVVIVAASGTSGAGKSLKPHLLGAEVMGAMSPYGVGGVHRHTPEIEQNLSGACGEAVRVSFTPTLAPMPRGILATCTAPLAEAAGVSAADVRAAWEKAYADEPFVHLLPEGQWPSTASVLGSNSVHVQVALDERVGRVVAVAAVDNLTKGTAGAAVQCLNLATGLPETAGLPVAGVAP